MMMMMMRGPPTKPFIFYISLMIDPYETTTWLSRIVDRCVSIGPTFVHLGPRPPTSQIRGPGAPPQELGVENADVNGSLQMLSCFKISTTRLLALRCSNIYCCKLFTYFTKARHFKWQKSCFLRRGRNHSPGGAVAHIFAPPPTKPLNPLCVPGFAPFKGTAFLQKYLGEQRSLDPLDHATAVYSRRQSIANGVNSQWCLVFQFFCISASFI